MHHLIILITFCLGFHSLVWSQDFDYQAEMEEVTATLQDPVILDSLARKAIENSHLIKALGQEVQVFDEEVKQKKRLWLSSFRLGVNAFSANTTLDQNNQSTTTYGVLPTLGVNVSIDVEKIVNRGSYIRQSRHRREYAQQMQYETQQDIRMKIRGMYYDYLLHLETINVRQNALQMRKQQELFLKNQVKTGEATYEQLLIVSNQVHLSEEALIKARLNARKKRDEIEVFINSPK